MDRYDNDGYKDNEINPEYDGHRVKKYDDYNDNEINPEYLKNKDKYYDYDDRDVNPEYFETDYDNPEELDDFMSSNQDSNNIDRNSNIEPDEPKNILISKEKAEYVRKKLLNNGLKFNDLGYDIIAYLMRYHYIKFNFNHSDIELKKMMDKLINNRIPNKAEDYGDGYFSFVDKTNIGDNKNLNTSIDVIRSLSKNPDMFFTFINNVADEVKNNKINAISNHTKQFSISPAEALYAIENGHRDHIQRIYERMLADIISQYGEHVSDIDVKIYKMLGLDEDLIDAVNEKEKNHGIESLSKVEKEIFNSNKSKQELREHIEKIKKLINY